MCEIGRSLPEDTDDMLDDMPAECGGGVGRVFA